jgi:hypothetical protein
VCACVLVPLLSPKMESLTFVFKKSRLLLRPRFMNSLTTKIPPHHQRHTQHTHKHTHTHPHTHPHTHVYTQNNESTGLLSPARKSRSVLSPPPKAHTTHTQAHTLDTHTHTPTQCHTRIHTEERKPDSDAALLAKGTHANTHIHTRTCCSQTHRHTHAADQDTEKQARDRELFLQLHH